MRSGRPGTGAAAEGFGLVEPDGRLGQRVVPRRQLRLIRLVISELSG